MFGVAEQFAAKGDGVQVLLRIAKANSVNQNFVHLNRVGGERVRINDRAMPPKQEVFFLRCVGVQSDEIGGKKVVEVAHRIERLHATAAAVATIVTRSIRLFVGA